MNDDSRRDAARGYALGASGAAARRLAIQDAQFAAISERLLDRLNVGASDRVVELGTGAGSFSRRVLHRLGATGTLIGIAMVVPVVLRHLSAMKYKHAPA